MNDAHLGALRRRDARQLDKFLKNLRRSAKPWALECASTSAWPSGFNGISQAPGWAFYRPLQALQDLGLAVHRLTLAVARLPWRRIILGGSALTATATAIAASQVWVGYQQHKPEFWAQRLSQRLGSAIFSSDGQLLGTLFPRAAQSGGLNYADYGHIRTEGEPPELWKRFVVTLEQKSLFDPWRTVCGVDPLGIVKRVATGVGGGSGLAEQNAKNLMAPEDTRSPYRVVQILQKVRSWGAACALHQAQGGAEDMLRLYATIAPVAQVNGTTRGVQAGAWVLFNQPPDRLQPHQLALLAALVQRPLALAPASAFAKGCEALRSTSSSELSKLERRARNQCFNIFRAAVAVQRVMEGDARDAALAALAALEMTGIVPENPFQPLPTVRLVNLSARTQAALSPAMVQRIAEEAETVDVSAGETLTLTLAQRDQFSFERDLRLTLKQIDDSVAGRENLCAPLSAATAPRHCPGTPAEAAYADVVLVRMSVETGGLTRLFESNRLVFGARNAVGSVGKMIIALAAVRSGYTAQTLVCPRQARDGQRLLRRVTKPEFGYRHCGPKQLITLGEAMARSDKLAAYEVARTLGRDGLRSAIAAVGLTADDDPKANLAFQLAFGTQPGTPQELLILGQALFGVAFGLPVQSAGPRVLAHHHRPAPAYLRVKALLPQPAQRQALRDLLQAPVTHGAGTLHHLEGVLAAGKTGTTSAVVRPQPGARAYLQAKYTLAYAPADRTVVLAIFNAPFGHALGRHSMPGPMLAPAITALLK